MEGKAGPTWFVDFPGAGFFFFFPLVYCFPNFYRSVSGHGIS